MSWKLCLARCRVLCEVGDCFGRETVRAKEEREEEEGGGLRGQREAGQVYWVSVSAGHDHNSMLIATRREQTEWGAVKGHRMVRCWKQSDNRLEEAQCTVSRFNRTATTDWGKTRIIWQRGHDRTLEVFAYMHIQKPLPHYKPATVE